MTPPIQEIDPRIATPILEGSFQALPESEQTELFVELMSGSTEAYSAAIHIYADIEEAAGLNPFGLYAVGAVMRPFRDQQKFTDLVFQHDMYDSATSRKLLVGLEGHRTAYTDVQYLAKVVGNAVEGIGKNALLIDPDLLPAKKWKDMVTPSLKKFIITPDDQTPDYNSLDAIKDIVFCSDSIMEVVVAAEASGDPKVVAYAVKRLHELERRQAYSIHGSRSQAAFDLYKHLDAIRGVDISDEERINRSELEKTTMMADYSRLEAAYEDETGQKVEKLLTKLHVNNLISTGISVLKGFQIDIVDIPGVADKYRELFAAIWLAEGYIQLLRPIVEQTAPEAMSRMIAQFSAKEPANIGELFAGVQTIEMPGECELDFEVLKSEGSLREFAQEIVDAAKVREKKELRLDLERLQVLERLREEFDISGTSYYARTAQTVPRSRSRVHVLGAALPLENDYIVLVIQESRSDGSVIEHAIAESPIAGNHAVYVHRADVSTSSWREVFSRPKVEARRLGARAVKHTCLQGEDLYATMKDKLGETLTCSREAFLAGNWRHGSRLILTRTVEVAA